MNEPIPFQTPQVRDLAWACFSPPLILAGGLSADVAVTDCEFELTTQRRAWLEQLDQRPQPLLQHLSQRRSHRLGIYFESLWHFFLAQDAQCELLAHNLPVHHDGRTLGEFDCLYFCHRRQKTIHLELAVKFFLGSGTPDNAPFSAANQWLGPDAKDRLDLKLAHLLQRQIRLSAAPPAREALQALQVNVQEREVAFRGYLFTPYAAPIAPPPGFNPAVSLNKWLTRTQCEAYLNACNGSAFTLLEKMHWLGPAQLDTAQAADSADTVKTVIDAHFAHSGYPVMLASLDGFGREIKRHFVTCDNWPASQANET